MKARSRIRRGLALTASLTLGLLMFGARPAAAAVTCSFAAGTVTVATSLPGDNAVVSVGPGGTIQANGNPCGGTVVTTNTILWDDNSVGATTFTIDLSGGPFAPGATDEAGTTDEIEFDLSSDSGVLASDTLVILGTSVEDVIIAGDGPGPGFPFAEDSANLNNDDDADVSIFSNNFRMSGGPGDDTLTANGGSGTGGAFDPPAVIQGQDGNDDLYGGDNGDAIGGSGAAESGADVITGGAGNDTMVGGDPTSDPFPVFGGFGGGADMINYTRETGVADGVDDLDLPEVGAGPDTLVGDTFNNTDSVNEFEHVSGSLLDDVNIDGNDQNNLINGSNGADNIFDGDNGNDFIFGGLGNDINLDGQAGNDVVKGNEGDDVNLSGGAGDDSIDGGIGNDTNMDGNPGNDVIEGFLGNDEADGGDGNDTLLGGDGNDTLQGGNGADDVFPGLGTDAASGGAGGSDVVDYGDIPGPINGNLETGTVTGASTDTIGAFEGLNGTPAGDTLSGGGSVTTAGAVIKGKKGNDSVTGTNGEDLLLGGRGGDVVNGLGADDIVRGNDGGDTLQGQAGEDLVAGGGGADSLRGGSGDDVLRGQGSNDDLNGGGGDDILNGGTGIDSCSGGAGSDVERACEL